MADNTNKKNYLQLNPIIQRNFKANIQRTIWITLQQPHAHCHQDKSLKSLIQSYDCSPIPLKSAKNTWKGE